MHHAIYFRADLQPAGCVFRNSNQFSAGSAGSAKSYAIEAIQLAEAGKMDEAEGSLQKADEEMPQAHKTQPDLIQQEAKGNHTQINLFMVHAQNHIMTAMLAKDWKKGL